MGMEWHGLGGTQESMEMEMVDVGEQWYLVSIQCCKIEEDEKKERKKREGDTPS